jgi:hypothetical protein
MREVVSSESSRRTPSSFSAGKRFPEVVSDKPVFFL